MADPPVLQARHAFGLKGDVSSPIHYGDEATTIYPCGHSVVLYNSEAKDQELIPGLPQTKGITALALAPSRKWLCVCLLYTSPSPRDGLLSRMPSSA